MTELLRALAFKLNGPKFHNAAFGEALWEVARRATTRHIENPDEMLNQQVGERGGERRRREQGRTRERGVFRSDTTCTRQAARAPAKHAAARVRWPLSTRVTRVAPSRPLGAARSKQPHS